ncbi:MAG: UDP-glucose/GDP-mannose dehydrogenase family protein [Planctomycetia bacterium]|nr:UDP-glucose/GDP-mannose dehydrogenase family protein [Planctomycetia bacterium]
MKIAVVGAGYVGLVTGACFAETGSEVACVDIDEAKIEGLARGEVPIYEPGLTELVRKNSALGRLLFTTRLKDAVAGARFVFLAIGTPQAENGEADLSSLWKVVEQLAPVVEPQTTVVIKSTVPVGTNAAVARRLAELCRRPVDVASNPEFLREGSAIDDFMRPDRVVVGVRSAETAAALRELYRPFQRTEHPFLSMSPESAEMTKYVANALLAAKISFINEISRLCERTSADINDVRRGIGHDSRIGFAFLFPGLGYGGSCFPKDVRALVAVARKLGVETRMLQAVDEVNDEQKHVFLAPLMKELGQQLTGKKIAMWGLSFKPRTDDIREAPALVIIDGLLSRGAQVVVHDPVAMENVRQRYGDRIAYVEAAKGAYAALEGSDALVISTEWKEYQHPDFELMKKLMRRALVFDGRNIFEPEQMAAEGFVYYSIGRAAVRGANA